MYYWPSYIRTINCDYNILNCSGQSFPGDPPLVGSGLDCEVLGSGTKLILQSNSKYIQEIRQRLEENATAQEQRGKRRERFLVAQLKAHEAQEVKLLLPKNINTQYVMLIEINAKLGDMRIHLEKSFSLPKESFSSHLYLVIYPFSFVDHKENIS